jgi:hypothetical protein
LYIANAQTQTPFHCQRGLASDLADKHLEQIYRWPDGLTIMEMN